MYGKEDLFDAERVVDLLGALETFTAASSSAQGELGKPQAGGSRYASPPLVLSILDPVCRWESHPSTIPAESCP